jgi:dipeptidyl aminopeptidase/acylaminoacyl peptidase
MLVPATGGVPRPATDLHEDELIHIRPAFLPDGRHFLYRATNPANTGNFWIGSLDSSDRTLLFENTTTGNVAYSDGRLLFMNGTTLVAQRFDPNSLKLAGAPVPIAEQVETSGVLPPVGAFSASTSGALVYRMGTAAGVGGQLTLLDRSGKTLSTIGDRGDYSDIELSRDGTRAAVSVRDPNTNMRDLWLVDLDRGLSSRLTFTPSNGMRSAWSPDGSKLVFSRDQNRMDIFITSVTGGTSSEQPLLANDDFNRSL